MCGIVGAVSDSDVRSLLLRGLAHLEYRGYDSAGVVLLEKGAFHRQRAKGDLSFLRQKIKKTPLSGSIGIGHTRWATHGAPSVKNAHPHIVSDVAIVHNGIIENFADLKSLLKPKKISYKSDTDSEIIAHLLASFLEEGLSAGEAFDKTLALLKGSFAIVALMRGRSDSLFAASSGSPLVIAKRKGAFLIASDALAYASESEALLHLEEGERACLSRQSLAIWNAQGRKIKRAFSPPPSTTSVSRGKHRFFMEKEIFEAPEAVSRTLDMYLGKKGSQIHMEGFPQKERRKVRQIMLVGCGSAAYASLAASYWMEAISGIPARAEIASEFRHRGVALPEGTLVIPVSQSGETADTLSALKHCVERGAASLAVVNVMGSTMERLASSVLPISAGPEMGVAATKTLLCQMTTLAALALAFAKDRSHQDMEAHLEDLRLLPKKLKEVLLLKKSLKNLAKKHLAPSDYALYLGRGIGYPVALEGALKCKEIAYIKTDGYPAGEMKHGPIALIHNKVPVVVIAPCNALFPKMLSNMEEIVARGGRVHLLTDEEGAKQAAKLAHTITTLPRAGDIATAPLYALAVQILAFESALALGHDPDRPRNLAKSVTVE